MLAGTVLRIEVRIDTHWVLGHPCQLVWSNHVLLLMAKGVKALSWGLHHRHGSDVLRSLLVRHAVHLPHELVERLSERLLKSGVVLPILLALDLPSITLEWWRVHTRRDVDNFAFLGDAGLASSLVNFT